MVTIYVIQGCFTAARYYVPWYECVVRVSCDITKRTLVTYDLHKGIAQSKVSRNDRREYGNWLQGLERQHGSKEQPFIYWMIVLLRNMAQITDASLSLFVCFHIPPPLYHLFLICCLYVHISPLSGAADEEWKAYCSLKENQQVQDFMINQDLGDTATCINEYAGNDQDTFDINPPFIFLFLLCCSTEYISADKVLYCKRRDQKHTWAWMSYR